MNKRPNFKIVENSETVNYEDFKKDYMGNELTVDQIRKKYNLGNCAYYGLIKKVEEETGFYRKKTNKTKNTREPKYYTGDKYRGYSVQKIINNKRFYFGNYRTIDEAKKVVEWLKEHNWDKNSFERWRESI